MEQFLIFSLGSQRIGMPLLEVRQVIEHTPPTRVPHLPEVVRGVINLRGSAAPVVDLALRFGMPAQAVTKSSCIVLAEAPEVGQLGILADSVDEVIDLDATALLPVPDFGIPIEPRFLRGLAAVEGGLALLLDTARLLTPEELLAVRQ